MNDEVIAAIEDFELALLAEGPAQALNTLSSYTVELTGASVEALEKLSQIYCSYLQRSPPCESAGSWNLRCEAKKILTSSFLKAHPILIAQLQLSWRDSLGSVVLNLQNASVDDHLASLKALENFLSEAVAGAETSLQEGNYFTVRSLFQTALFSTSLPSAHSNLQLHHHLERILETSLASWLHGASSLEPLAQACASLVQNIFEAALDTIQAATTVQSIAQLDHESQKIYWNKAWSLLSSLQKISFSSPAAVCDIFWGAYASTIFQLSTLVSRHGRDHPALSCAVKLLCNPESANMMLQCLLAIPATSSAAAAGSGAAAGAGNLKSMKSAFKTALILLRDFPDAFVAACCDILTPAANAALGTRIEALHAIKLALDQRSSNTECIWTQSALEKLLFAMSRDPSVRLRRKAIELLQQTLRKTSFPADAAALEAAVLAAVAERCTDQDADVRRVAYICLNSVQFSKLVAVLSAAQWRRIFEHGLAVCPPFRGGQAAGAASNSRQAQEIISASKRLFEKYLRQDEEENEENDEDSEIVEESKAVFRLHELLFSNATTATAASVLLASTELTAVLAEILTERDLTNIIKQT